MRYERQFWQGSRVEPNFDLVVVGMSLGGMHIFGQILAELPAEFPIAIAAVQHLSPQFPSQLVEILQHSTPLRVKWARQGASLEPGSVYVAPPNYHLSIGPDATCAISQGPKICFTRPAVDVLFASAAERCRTLGLVLTGGGRDGSAGARAIQAAGGMVIVQDPSTAFEPSMPRTVIRERGAMFVLPPSNIAHALVSLGAVPGTTDLFGCRRAA